MPDLTHRDDPDARCSPSARHALRQATRPAIYGVKLRGWPAWVLHRVYHLSRVPTLNRKARVVADWTLALLFRRDVVSLDQVQHPREAWESSNNRAA